MPSGEQFAVQQFMEIAGQKIGRHPELPLPPEDEAVALYSVAKECLGAAKKLSALKGAHALRARLLVEEVGEICAALSCGDLVMFADGLADLEYVNLGAAVTFGIDLEPVFEEVHRSNLSKFPVCRSCQDSALKRNPEYPCQDCKGLGRIVVKDANGKVQKPPGWTEPDVAAVLDCQRPR